MLVRNSEVIRLLEAYLSTDDEEVRESQRQQAWAMFGQDRAVFVLDLGGFSKTTQQLGPLHSLAITFTMHRLVEPLVTQNGGEVVKFEADNCFAHFPDVNRAVTTAAEIQETFERENKSIAENLKLSAGIGISWGRILVFEDLDFFGEAVNTASRLGEDTANSGEILICAAARNLCGNFQSAELNDAGRVEGNGTFKILYGE